MEKWKTAIREAQTFSRMHVLLGMLDACIKWDMSAENARCKVCRKKGMQPHVCVTVGRCHLSMPCLGNVPLLLSLCLWLYFEFWPSGFTHSEALISQKRLTLTSNKPFWWNWYGELQNITVLLSPGYSGYLDTNVYKSFCGSFCATVHFSVSFMSWNGLWVSKPCQLIPSLTEGTSKKRLGRLMHPVTE